MKLRAIRENHLFSKVYAKGKKFVGRRVIVYVLPDYSGARITRSDPMHRRVNRVGITVTKKLGGAVERNRAKRIIRDGYRLADRKSPLKKGLLVVIVARSSIAGAKAQDIGKDISAAFVKFQNEWQKEPKRSGSRRPDSQSGQVPGGKESGGQGSDRHESVDAPVTAKE